MIITYDIATKFIADLLRDRKKKARSEKMKKTEAGETKMDIEKPHNDLREDPAPHESPMTTFWLTFSDPDAPSDKRFLGVAIFDIDESRRQASVVEIVRKAHKLGINPGGQVSVQEVESIPDEYKNRLIIDDALLLKLGSRGAIYGHTYARRSARAH
jgi:hypothetical protein